MAHNHYLQAEAISQMTPEQHKELDEKGSVDIQVYMPVNLVTKTRRWAGEIHNIK